jgi:ADP-ribosylglycohydrolase
MNLYNRIFGCLAGLALGDSLGGPTEFLTRAQIKVEYGWVDHLVQAPACHPHHVLQPGQITDDTGQVLAVARSLGADGQTTAEDVARCLLIWAEQAGDTLAVVIGPSTRKALDRLRNGESPRLTGQSGTTNGAAYRAVIPGLVNYARPEQILPQVLEVCLPTHGTTVAISGAAAVAFAIASALSNASCLENILEAAKSGARAGRELGTWAWGTPLEKRIELAVRLVNENPQPEAALSALADYVGTDMLVPESVACAFGVVALAGGDPMKAIQYGANLGGDTDTIAALAGAVCGAWKGADAIDRNMLAQVESVSHTDLAAEAARLVSIIEKRQTRWAVT